jgi:hypothetical protein
MKHTPGPWRCIDGRLFSESFISKVPIATIHKSARSPEDSHLIAAAPEMLEALKVCLRRRECVDDPGQGLSIQESIREIIAKAEGVTS